MFTVLVNSDRDYRDKMTNCLSAKLKYVSQSLVFLTLIAPPVHLSSQAILGRNTSSISARANQFEIKKFSLICLTKS